MDIQRIWMLLQIVKLSAECGSQFARFGSMAQAELDEIGKESERKVRLPTIEDAPTRPSEAPVERRPINE